MRVSIHQPNFLPWYPFFEKMRSVDVFVLLGHCQFEKGKFQNRFRLHDQWHTMSVNHGLEPIVDKRYTSFQKDWSGIKSRLPQLSHVLCAFDEDIQESLHDTNVAIIRKIARLLEISTQIEMDSPTTTRATDRLVELCLKHGATTYVAGTSGGHYMELEKFERAGIKVETQDLSSLDRRHTLEILAGMTVNCT